MSAIVPVSHRSEVFPVEAIVQRIEDLQYALRMGNFPKAKECTRILLGTGRELIAQNVASGKGINPLPITLNFFELLNSPSLEWEEELLHDLTRVGRLFIELTCMKATQENRKLSPQIEGRLKASIDQLLARRKEDQVGLSYELICCQEAFKLMEHQDAKEYLILVLKALASPNPTTVITNLLGLIPVFLQKRHKIWYADSLYISWAGSTALSDLKLLRSIRAEFASKCESLEISQTFVELFGHLAWNGIPEVQMEALQGEPGLLSLSDIKAKHKLSLNKTMWPVRLRAIEILSSLTLHSNSAIATLATNNLLERRIRETNPKVLSVLEKLEAQPEIRARWKEQFEVNKEAILEENVKAKDELSERERELKAKEQDLVNRASMLTSIEEKQRMLQEKEALLAERRELQELRNQVEQQSKNTQHLYEVMYKAVNAVIDDILESQAFSSEPPEEFLCPIGAGVMEDPVVAPDGHTYERANIARWLEENGKSPLTNEPMALVFFPNRNLKEAIARFHSASSSSGSQLRPLARGSGALPSVGRSSSSSASNQPPQNASEGTSLVVEGQSSLRGVGTLKDVPTAIIRFEQAALLGNPYAEFYMGFLYSEDRSKTRNQGLQALSLQGDLLASDLLAMWDYRSGFHPKSNSNAVDLYLKAAEKGVAIAECYLGSMYADGSGVDKNEAKAAEWFLKAAKKGNSEGQYYLGDCYFNGRGVPQDRSQGISWIEKSASLGNVIAMCALAAFYSKGTGVPQDDVRAASWYQKGAELGYANAQNMLGRCYHSGKGLPQDFAKAAYWYKKAIAQNHPEAKLNLEECPHEEDSSFAKYGEIPQASKSSSTAPTSTQPRSQDSYLQEGLNCLRSKGASRDLSKAANLLAQAAKLGNPDAEFYLGFLHSKDRSDTLKRKIEIAAENGDKLASDQLILWNFRSASYPVSDASACKWYMSAAEHGNAKAQYYLAISLENGLGVTRNTTQAFSWYKKAAESGEAQAQNHLGTCFKNGTGCNKDLIEAFNWFQKAAKQGNPNAQYSLGYCYEQGEGTISNPGLTIEWYHKAAKQGLPVAQHQLGRCYECGFGVTKDPAQEASWYRKAADQGFTDAQFALAQCYNSGKGVAKDTSLAIRWFIKASLKNHTEAKGFVGSWKISSTSRPTGTMRNWMTSDEWAFPNLRKDLPPYPPELKSFLEGPCPIWGRGFLNRTNGKTAAETHIVVPLFKTIILVVDGVELEAERTLKTLDILEKLTGAPGFRYTAYDPALLSKDHLVEQKSFQWAVMAKNPFPGTVNEKKGPGEAYKLVTSKGYEIPSVLDAATALLWENRTSKVRYFNDTPYLYTYCKEYCLKVGGFSDKGLGVLDSDYMQRDFGLRGVAGFKRF